MKIIPLFDKDMNSNSSKLLTIEPTNINLGKINKYKTVSLNCNFSSNYLNRLLKFVKIIIIIKILPR